MEQLYLYNIDRLYTHCTQITIFIKANAYFGDIKAIIDTGDIFRWIKNGNIFWTIKGIVHIINAIKLNK